MNCRPRRECCETSAQDQNWPDMRGYEDRWIAPMPTRTDLRTDDGPDDLARPEVSLRYVRAKIVARTVLWLQWLAQPAVYTREEVEALPWT